MHTVTVFQKLVVRAGEYSSENDFVMMRKVSLKYKTNGNGNLTSFNIWTVTRVTKDMDLNKSFHLKSSF